ncbi:MAG: ABC transporter permease [Bradyrhizobiaceae bacterium]|nr:MAG: ABC transporter permease [Bradyrhizobiaceae bacterium]
MSEQAALENVEVQAGATDADQSDGLAAVSTPVMAACQIVFGIVLLVIWQAASTWLIDPFFISSPTEVLARLWAWTRDGSIFVHIWATLYATFLGFIIGSVAGVIGGIWLGMSPFVSRLLNPYIWAFNALPKVALAPLLILWFGLGIQSKVALAAVLVVFLVFVNTFSGVREVDRDLIDGVRLMKANRSQILMKVILPSAMSWIFVGLKSALPFALIGVIIGEMIASNKGLGYLVQRAGSEFDTAGAFAALTIIAVIAAVLNELVQAAQSRLERWKIVSR